MSVVFKNVTACWSTESNAGVYNIDLECPKAGLTAIVGPVGSGKTSLLQVVLKELPVQRGK